MKNLNLIGNPARQLGFEIGTSLSISALSAKNRWLGDALGLSTVKGSKIAYYYDRDKVVNFKSVYAAPIARYALKKAQDYALEKGKKALKRVLYGKDEAKFRNTIDLVKKYDRDNVIAHYGQLSVNKGKAYIPAVDMRGNYCRTAFIMGIKLATPIPYKFESAYKANRAADMKSQSDIAFHQEFNKIDTTDTLVWFDCSALVTMNSEKNIILTQVQGRDYTRKELVSNGDVSFTVSGRMCSNVSGVYPAAEVQKFIQIMNYKGVIRCNHIVLKQFGIDKFIIKSWSLTPKEGFENTQEYSFECVGLQPDRETVVAQDTIRILDQAISTSPAEKGWVGLMNEKLTKLTGSQKLSESITKKVVNGAVAGAEDISKKAASVYLNKALD